MNIECNQETLDELEHAFRFNDAVLRHLTVKTKAAATEPSAMMREEKSRTVSTETAQAAPQAAPQVAPPAEESVAAA
jgi:small subunit ribosomal protein S6